MKYFTPELYQLMQEEYHTTFESRWNQVCVAYRAHLEEIMPHLNEGAQALAKMSFHDGYVTKIGYDGEKLKVVLDTTNGVCEPIGEVTLTFFGVKSIDGIETFMESHWIYFEMHLHREAAFEYRVLLPESTFSVAADRVKIQHVPQSHRSLLRG